MKPFRKILVPVDFSPHAGEAIQIAADLARRYEASLTLAHVYQPVAYPLPEGFVLYTPSQLAAMLTEFEKLLGRSKQEALAAGALQVETRLLQGPVPSELLALAREGFDLIVMGTHGRTGLQHALLGSITEKLVRTAPCPVLTARLTTQ